MIKKRILAIFIDSLFTIFFGVACYFSIVRLRALGINILPWASVMDIIFWFGSLSYFVVSTISMIINNSYNCTFGMCIMNIQYKDKDKMKKRFITMIFFFSVWMANWASVITKEYISGSALIVEIILFVPIFFRGIECVGWDYLAGLREVEIRNKKDSNT